MGEYQSDQYYDFPQENEKSLYGLHSLILPS